MVIMRKLLTKPLDILDGKILRNLYPPPPPPPPYLAHLITFSVLTENTNDLMALYFFM